MVGSDIVQLTKSGWEELSLFHGFERKVNVSVIQFTGDDWYCLPNLYCHSFLEFRSYASWKKGRHDLNDGVYDFVFVCMTEF